MIFLNSSSSAAALVFYLPGVCTHTDTEGKQSPEYFNILRKYTIFNEHPVAEDREAKTACRLRGKGSLMEKHSAYTRRID